MKDKADKKRALVQFLKYNAGLKPSRVDKKVQIFSGVPFIIIIWRF